MGFRTTICGLAISCLGLAGLPAQAEKDAFYGTWALSDTGGKTLCQISLDQNTKYPTGPGLMSTVSGTCPKPIGGFSEWDADKTGRLSLKNTSSAVQFENDPKKPGYLFGVIPTAISSRTPVFLTQVSSAKPPSKDSAFPPPSIISKVATSELQMPNFQKFQGRTAKLIISETPSGEPQSLLSVTTECEITLLDRLSGVDYDLNPLYETDLQSSENPEGWCDHWLQDSDQLTWRALPNGEIQIHTTNLLTDRRQQRGQSTSPIDLTMSKRKGVLKSERRSTNPTPNNAKNEIRFELKLDTMVTAKESALSFLQAAYLAAPSPSGLDERFAEGYYEVFQIGENRRCYIRLQQGQKNRFSGSVDKSGGCSDNVDEITGWTAQNGKLTFDINDYNEGRVAELESLVRSKYPLTLVVRPVPPPRTPQYPPIWVMTKITGAGAFGRDGKPLPPR